MRRSQVFKHTVIERKSCLQSEFAQRRSIGQMPVAGSANDIFPRFPTTVFMRQIGITQDFPIAGAIAFIATAKAIFKIITHGVCSACNSFVFKS